MTHRGVWKALNLARMSIISGGKGAWEIGSWSNWAKLLNQVLRLCWEPSPFRVRVCFERIDLLATPLTGSKEVLCSLWGSYSPLCVRGTLRCWGDWLKDLCWASPEDSWDPLYGCWGFCAVVQRPGPRPHSSLLRPVWSVQSQEVLNGWRWSNQKAQILKEQKCVDVLEFILSCYSTCYEIDHQPGLFGVDRQYLLPVLER